MSTLLDRPVPPAEAPAAASTTLQHVVAVRRRVRRRRDVVLGVLLILLVLLVLARALLGDYTVTIPDAVRIIGGAKIPGATFILMESKLPRAVMAVIAGAAFGAAGAAYQSMLRNPLASPDILGITLGASTAAVFGVVILGLSGAGVTAIAFAGALAVAVAIHAFAGGGGGATGRMILVGIGLSAMLSALIQWVLLKADVYRAQDALVWLSGSLTSVTWTSIARLLVVVAILLPILVLLSRQLEALSLGDDLAAGLGIATGRVRLGVTLCVVLLTASATAVAGPIAFVGFLSGPIARRLRGGRTSIPTAALVGSCIVVAADYLAAYAIPDTNLPVGVVTGLAGAPFLLWLLASSGRRTS